MSPYIIRVSQPMPIDGTPGDGSPSRAVATLEEARTAVQGGWTRVQVEAALPESGGKVGPLPDGTVIEVEPVTWAHLAEAGDEDHDPVARGWHANVIAAYNARQSA